MYFLLQACHLLNQSSKEIKSTRRKPVMRVGGFDKRFSLPHIPFCRRMGLWVALSAGSEEVPQSF